MKNANLTSLIVVFLAACGGGDPAPTESLTSPPTPMPGAGEQTPTSKGIWVSDGYGGPLLLVNDRSEYRVIDTWWGIQGTGHVIHDSPKEFHFSYAGIPPVAMPQHIWPWTAICEFDAEIVDSGSDFSQLDFTQACEFSGDAADYVGATQLDYDQYNMHRLPLSDHPYDPANFEGAWFKPGNEGDEVINIDAAGLITGQNAVTGCVYQGRIFDRAPEGEVLLSGGIYDVEWTYASCTGESSYLNGIVFEGMAFFIDDAPDSRNFCIVAIGLMNDTFASLLLDFLPY